MILEHEKVRVFLEATNRPYKEKLAIYFEDWDSLIGLVMRWDQVKEACYWMNERAEND